FVAAAGCVVVAACFFGIVAAPCFRPGPNGWCLMTCVVAAALPPWPSIVMPAPISTAARSPRRAAYRTGGESVRVTRLLSAAERAHLKDERRGFPRPSKSVGAAWDYGQEPVTMSAPGPALFQTLPPTVLSTQ